MIPLTTRTSSVYFLNHETICQGYAYADAVSAGKTGGFLYDSHSETSATDRMHGIWRSWTGHTIIWIPPGGNSQYLSRQSEQKESCGFQVRGLQLFRGFHSGHYAVHIHADEQDSVCRIVRRWQITIMCTRGVILPSGIRMPSVRYCLRTAYQYRREK